MGGSLAVLHWPEPWKIYNTHDSVTTAWYSIAISLKHYAHGHCISVLHKKGVGIFFKSLTWYFYFEKTPHTYNDSHSLVICLLMQVVPAYVGLLHLFHVLYMYVLCNDTSYRVWCAFKRKGPFVTNF